MHLAERGLWSKYDSLVTNTSRLRDQPSTRRRSSSTIPPGADDRVGDNRTNRGKPRTLSSEKLSTDHILVAAEIRDLGPIGAGLFATEPIAAGALVSVMGGYVTPGPVFRRLPIDRQRRSVQIGEDLYLVSDSDPCTADHINHSCEPNCVLIGEITLAAWRDIEVGEQLTYDYATSDSTPYDEFECECGSPSCRTKVTGEDWLDPEIQRRYDGHFAPYLRRRIDEIRAER